MAETFTIDAVGFGFGRGAFVVSTYEIVTNCSDCGIFSVIVAVGAGLVLVVVVVVVVVVFAVVIGALLLVLDVDGFRSVVDSGVVLSTVTDFVVRTVVRRCGFCVVVAATVVGLREAGRLDDVVGRFDGFVDEMVVPSVDDCVAFRTGFDELIVVAATVGRVDCFGGNFDGFFVAIDDVSMTGRRLGLLTIGFDDEMIVVGVGNVVESSSTDWNVCNLILSSVVVIGRRVNGRSRIVVSTKCCSALASVLLSVISVAECGFVGAELNVDGRCDDDDTEIVTGNGTLDVARFGEIVF